MSSFEPKPIPAPQVMKLYKCWVDATETKEEMEKYQLDYLREGNAGDPAPEGNDDADPTPKPKDPAKNKENPKTIKEKTTTQLANKVLWLNNPISYN